MDNKTFLGFPPRRPKGLARDEALCKLRRAERMQMLAERQAAEKTRAQFGMPNWPAPEVNGG